MKLNLKSLLPHVIALAVFIIISSIYFSPLFDSKELRQGDISHFKGMSKEVVDYREEYGEEPLWITNMFSGMPAYQVSVIYSQNILRYIDQAIQLGLPRPVAYLMMCMLGFYILFMCLKVNPWVAIGLSVLAGLSSINIMYLGAGHTSKVRAISYMAPYIGGLIYAFRSNWLKGSAVAAFFLALHVYSNHLQMTYYLMFLTAFIGVSETIRLIRLSKAKELPKVYSGLLIAALMALLPNINNIVSTYEYSKYTMRGETELTISPKGTDENKPKNLKGLEKDYIVEYSLGEGEVLSWLVPNVKGGANKGAMSNIEEAVEIMNPNYAQYYSQFSNYWGEQRFTGGAFYFGIVLAVLFLISLFISKDSIKWSLLAFSILAMLLSMKYGSLTESFIDGFPMFSKFRDTKMIMVGISIAFAIMSGLLIQEFLDKRIETSQSKLVFSALGAVALIFVLLSFTPESFFDFTSNQEKEALSSYIAQGGEQGRVFQAVKSEIIKGRVAIFKTDAQRSLLFALLTIAFVFVLFKNMVNAIYASLAISIIGLIDVYNVDQRYLNGSEEGIARYYQNENESRFPNKFALADESILNAEFASRPDLAQAVKEKAKVKKSEDESFSREAQQEYYCGQLRLNSNYRVLPLNNPFLDARTANFHKSIGGYHAMKLGSYQDLIEFVLTDEISAVMKYLKSGQNPDSAFSVAPILNMLNTKYVIYNENAPALRNDLSLGQAWFVQDVKVMKDANSLMDELAYGGFDPRVEALIKTDHSDLIQGVSDNDLAFNESIEMTSFKPNDISYKTSSKENRLAVFSEVYFEDGWQAYIDGEKVEHLPVNYLLRGLSVPAGEHEVRFVFEPSRFHTLNTVSLISSILLVIVSLFIIIGGSIKENTIENA